MQPARWRTPFKHGHLLLEHHTGRRVLSDHAHAPVLIRNSTTPLMLGGLVEIRIESAFDGEQGTKSTEQVFVYFFAT